MHLMLEPTRAMEPAHPLEVKDPPPEAVRAQLERMLGGALFSRSERLRRFLRYVVEQKLSGRQHQLSEYAIATEVYDRASSFNPATDTIVRVEARRLRSTLERYYAAEGRPDRVWISVPKGGYEPAFSRKATLPPEVEPDRGVSSVAVLPFEDLGLDGDQERFCEGVSEEIVGALAEVDGLRVAAGWLVCASDSRHPDIRSIREEWHADSIVRGTVRRAGERMRVTVQVVSAVSGYNVWSHRFDECAHDVFAVQDQVASTVAAAFQRRFGRDQIAGEGR